MESAVSFMDILNLYLSIGIGYTTVCFYNVSIKTNTYEDIKKQNNFSDLMTSFLMLFITLITAFIWPYAIYWKFVNSPKRRKV